MLIAFVGNQGWGKTLGMTVFGVALAKICGLPILANYELRKDLEAKKIESTKDLWEAKNSVVMIDELYRSVDSRAWKDNTLITGFFTQVRKADLILMYTTQKLGQVDLRIRDATDFIVFCERLSAGRHLLRFVDMYTEQFTKKYVIDDPEPFYSLYNHKERQFPIPYKEVAYAV